MAQPSTWTRSEDGIFCLSCSRALAGEAAVDGAPEDCSSEDRARLRRSAVIAFEVRRAPDSPDGRIASACRTSASAVKAVRAQIEQSEEAVPWR